MVEELFAYIAEIAPGEDGIIAAVIPGYGSSPLPMVFHSLRQAEKVQYLIREKSKSYTNIRLVRYTQAEVLREIK